MKDETIAVAEYVVNELFVDVSMRSGHCINDKIK